MKKKIKKIVFLLPVCKYSKSYMKCLVMSKQRNKDLDLIYGPVLASRFQTLLDGQAEGGGKSFWKELGSGSATSASHSIAWHIWWVAGKAGSMGLCV